MNKKHIFSTLVFLGFLLITLIPTYVTYAQTGITTGYVPLTTLPGVFDRGSSTNPVAAITGFYGLAIGIGAVIAVIMIIYAGFTYMYQESITGKSDAKSRIMNAFLGLLVILGSYIILRTINVDLVNFDLTLPGGSGRLKGMVTAIKETEARFDTSMKKLREAQATVADEQKKVEDLDKKITDLQKKVTDNKQETPEEISEAFADKQKVIELENTKKIKLADIAYTKTNALLETSITNSDLAAQKGDVKAVEVATQKRLADLTETRATLVKAHNVSKDPELAKKIEALDVKEYIYKTEMAQIKLIADYKDSFLARSSTVKEAIQKEGNESISWLRTNGYAAEATALEEATAQRIAIVAGD